MRIKAIGLLSGGLDSALALKVIQDMGVEVVAVKFTSPFIQSNPNDHAAQVARDLRIELVRIPLGDDALAVIRHPKHGYGSAINPCIDCHAFMLRKAREYMEEIGASFLITGEVLNQRPMSQHRKALDTVEKDAGVEGLLVRPLSAKNLPPTIPEKNGWIDREKLFAMDGRTRRPQIELAAKTGVKGYASAGGGCLLTERSYASRLRDLFRNKPDAAMRDLDILSVGRHYRIGADKAICGKDKSECKSLRAVAKPGDWIFDPTSDKGALVLLQKSGAEITAESFDFAAGLASAYCDGDSETVTISAQQKDGETRELRVPRAKRDDFKNRKL